MYRQTVHMRFTCTRTVGEANRTLEEELNASNKDGNLCVWRLTSRLSVAALSWCLDRRIWEVRSRSAVLFKVLQDMNLGMARSLALAAKLRDQYIRSELAACASLLDMSTPPGYDTRAVGGPRWARERTRAEVTVRARSRHVEYAFLVGFEQWRM